MQTTSATYIHRCIHPAAAVLPTHNFHHLRSWYTWLCVQSVFGPFKVVLYAVEWVMWPTLEPSQPLLNSFSHRAKATRSAVGCEVTAVLLLTQYMYMLSLPSKQNQFHHSVKNSIKHTFLSLLGNIRPYQLHVHWGDWEPFFLGHQSTWAQSCFTSSFHLLH